MLVAGLLEVLGEVRLRREDVPIVRVLAVNRRLVLQVSRSSGRTIILGRRVTCYDLLVRVDVS